MNMGNAWAWNATETLSSYGVPFVSLVPFWLLFYMLGLASFTHIKYRVNVLFYYLDTM